MAENEKVTPVTEDEIDDIRVTLELEDGEVVCKILTIFDVDKQDYIALVTLDENDKETEESEVYFYRYYEDENGLPSIDSIETEEEYEKAVDRFEELLDDDLYDEM